MADVSTKKSTIVRAGIGFKVRSFALALAERDAPRLGARLAVRMWMTIPPVAPANARPRLGPPGERVVLRTGRRSGDVSGRRGRDVVTECWAPTGSNGSEPVVYLLHGWGGYRGQFGAFVEPLTGAGFRVVAIDALGHGDSGPGLFGRGRGLSPDFTRALDAAIEHFGPPYALVAHSLGASAAAITVLNGLPVTRLVLIAPISTIMSGVEIFARMARVGPRVRALMPRRIERIVRMPLSHFDIVSRAAESEDLPPALVVHDSGDRTVPFDLGVLVAAAWPGGQLARTEGLGHRRILADPTVIGSVTGFVAGVPVPTGS
jgi:pimeloyl-ACP methyl ester carboxylesterase